MICYWWLLRGDAVSVRNFIGEQECKVNRHVRICVSRRTSYRMERAPLFPSVRLVSTYHDANMFA